MSPEEKMNAPSTNLATRFTRRAEFEKLVGWISRDFVGIESADLDRAILKALEEVGTFVGADRSYIFLYNRQDMTMSNTHEWCGNAIEPQQDILQNLPMSVFSWATSYLESNPVLDIPLVAQLPAEARAEKEILEEQDILSLVLVAMKGHGNQTIGFIGFDAVQEVRPWHEDDAFLLEILGGIIVAALEHKDSIQIVAENEARQRAILQAIPDQIFIIGRNGQIVADRTSHNPGPEAARRAFTGISTWKAVTEAAGSSINKAIRVACFPGQIGRFEAKVILDRQETWFEGRITYLPQGRFLALLRNVTNRFHSEQKLRKLALELSVAEEKNRRELAIKLHEGISQDLTGLLFFLESLKSREQHQTENLDRAISILQRAMRHTQDLTFDLSPPTLYELGLSKAIEALVRRNNLQYPIKFNMISNDPMLGLKHSTGILLYRIASELLTNVVRHSEATRAQIDLLYLEESIQLSVTDDGKGAGPEDLFSVGSRVRGGFGLFSIRQRLEPIGGTLALSTSNGFCATVTVPVSNAKMGKKGEALA